MEEKNRVVYCHFSFRRPRNKSYGIFAVAIYADKEGKKQVCRSVTALRLWEDHQHITAVQAYENALDCIWRWQASLLKYDVGHVMLVTDNGILAGWIEDPKKNKQYEPYMRKANMTYKIGAKKEIVLKIGLCEVLDYEKSHKYCKPENVKEEIRALEKKADSSAVNRLDLGDFKLASEIIKESIPEGMDDLKPIAK